MGLQKEISSGNIRCDSVRFRTKSIQTYWFTEAAAGSLTGNTDGKVAPSSGWFRSTHWSWLSQNTDQLPTGSSVMTSDDMLCSHVHTKNMNSPVGAFERSTVWRLHTTTYEWVQYREPFSLHRPQCYWTWQIHFSSSLLILKLLWAGFMF